MKKNITITWANEKGGVGKTTLLNMYRNEKEHYHYLGE